MRTLLTVTVSLAAGAALTRWYDRSLQAHRLVFWAFTADVRRTDPHLYGRHHNAMRRRP